MQLLPFRFFRRLPLRHTAALLALACLCAACDRHSAAEVPESYGHGSSHQKSYTDHEVDSRRDSHSFSDTQGIEVDKEGHAPASETPTPSPATPAPGHFFPAGN